MKLSFVRKIKFWWNSCFAELSTSHICGQINLYKQRWMPLLTNYQGSFSWRQHLFLKGSTNNAGRCWNLKQKQKCWKNFVSQAASVERENTQCFRSVTTAYDFGRLEGHWPKILDVSLSIDAASQAEFFLPFLFTKWSNPDYYRNGSPYQELQCKNICPSTETGSSVWTPVNSLF